MHDTCFIYEDWQDIRNIKPNSAVKQSLLVILFDDMQKVNTVGFARQIF